MKWQEVQKARENYAEFLAQADAAEDAARALKNEVRAAFDARLDYDLRLAQATALLLCSIADRARGNLTQDSEALWKFRDELEPLAQAYGFTICPSASLVGVGKLELVE